jgi:hypothetical protein
MYFVIYALFASGRCDMRWRKARAPLLVLGPSTSAVASRQLVDLTSDRFLDDRLGGVV